MQPRVELSGWRKSLRRPWYWGWGKLEDFLFAGHGYSILVPWGHRVLTPWFSPSEDPSFADAYAHAKAGGPVGVTPDRCYLLHRFCREALLRSGDVAECGVFQGGTAQLLAETIHQLGADGGRDLHLFDTFTGMPDDVRPDRDYHKAGDFSDTSIDAVRRRLHAYGRILFHEGRVPDTFAGVRDDARFAMVHLDMDVYQGTLDACRWFWPRMVRGGIMIFDDYGFYPYRRAARAAVDEWFSEQPESPICLPTGQGLAIKV